MNDYQKLYPKLTYFFSGYFHNDWTVMHDWQGNKPNFQFIVREFKEENSQETVIKATQELEQLIKQNLTEDDLHEIVVYKLGANIYARAMGLTYQKWLESVLIILKTEVS